MDLTIANSFFNEKFKDYIRNFYVYGCIPDSEFPGSLRTYHDDFMRIEHIGQIPLPDGDKKRDLRWRMERTSKCLRLITSESRDLQGNPVHIFYRLHESRETDALFFLTVMLLAAHFRKTDKDLKIEQIMAWTDPGWRAEWEKLCRSGDDEKTETDGDRTKVNKEKKKFRDKTQANIRKRMLQEFGSTGLLDFQSVGNSNLWSLRDLTLHSLLQSVSEEETRDLVTAITFFMKLGPFGEIGDMLLSRLDQKWLEGEQRGSICLNQFYLCKSLNDYNSADILQAIHSGSWAIVTYHQPQRDVSGYVLCRPLKLRSSVTSGREYMGYYDPVRRRACYLRLEYIQSVEVLDQRYIPWLWAALRGTECLVLRQREQHYVSCRPTVFQTGEDGSVRLAQYTGSGNRIQAELCFRDENGSVQRLSAREIEDCRLPDPERLEAEIGKAERLLGKAWGASIPYTSREQTLDELRVHVLTMTVYVWDGEQYIRSRLEREARCGFCRDLDEHRVLFEVEVLDPWEMLPWISSFVGRIKNVTCTDPDFEAYLRGHLRQMYDTAMQIPADEREPAAADPRKQNGNLITNLIRDSELQIHKGRLRNASPLCRKGPADHEILFAPLFSQVYQNCFTAFNGIFTAAGSEAQSPWQQAEKQAKDISILDQKELEKLETRPKPGTVARFQQLLPRIKSICRLAPDAKDMTPVMLKLVPLSVLERKWLLAILQDPLMGYFLQPDTVDLLSTVLKEAQTGRPLYLPGDIDYFDRYSNHSHSRAYTKRYFRLMCKAVKCDCSVHVTYRPPDGTREMEMDVLPLRMEYAARDNAFRIAVRDLNPLPDSPAVKILRLDRIQDVQQHGRYFQTAEKEWSRCRQEYVLRFSGEKNLPDRILTHFAPWQKQCVKLGDNDYCLRFWADENEWMDIMVRILSFGHLVRVEQPADVAREIRFRLARQKNMWM